MSHFQETEFGLARDLLKRLENRTVLDIGAEKGSFVEACLSADADRVFAFEPYPPHAEHLRRRFNGSSIVTVFEMAIGNRDEDAILHVAHDPSGQPLDYHHSLVAPLDTNEVRWRTSITVPCRTLGGLVAEGIIPAAVGLVKIDTEGSDLHAIQSLGDLISDVVMVEFCRNPCHAGDSPYDISELTRCLRERGYGAFVFIKRHDEFEVIQPGSEPVSPGDWGNLIFVHDRVRERLKAVLDDAASRVNDSLLQRALSYRVECEKRGEVLRLQKRHMGHADARDVGLPWIAPAPPGERERLTSGNPKVSIVTPSFNQARFLEQTIKSVLDQDYPNVEYIIVDGGSTDGSVDIIQRYADRLAFWISEPDRGQTDALNKGFARATGDIAAWVNSDDFYYPGAFTAAVAAFKADPDLGLLYGRGNRVSESGEIIHEFEATRPFDLEALVYGIDYILQPTTFMRRGALHAAGPFDLDLHYAFDWELWMRLGESFSCKMLDQVVAAGREYPSAKTFTGGFPRVEEIRQIVTRHTGKELSIGYLAYYMSTVLDAMLRSELGGSPLRDAIASAAAQGHVLLTQDRLRDDAPGHPGRLRETPPFSDGWAGPELRLRRVIPETASYICLDGVHQSEMARVLGPLALRARLNDHSLGVGVVLHPGPFRVYWQIPPGRFRPRDDGDMTVITACGLSGKDLGHPKEPRVFSFQFTNLSFQEAAPRGAYVVHPEHESAADAAVRAYRRAYLATEPGHDQWAGPEFHAEIPLPAAPGFLCLSGVHAEATARVGGPLNLWASIDGQLLGLGVVEAPGPFMMCWPLPADELARLRTAERDNHSCKVVFATPLSVVPAAFWKSGDRRAVAFCFTALEFRATRPANALMAQIPGLARESRFKRRLKRVARRLGLAV